MALRIRCRALLPTLPPGLRTVSREIRAAAKAEVWKYAILTQTAAIERAPVETGRLRSSIVPRFPTERDGLKAIIGTNVRAPLSGMQRAMAFEGVDGGPGYPYPARQEFDETLQHAPPVTRHHRGGGTKQGFTTTVGRQGGEWGYMRKALAANREAFAKAIQGDVDRLVRAALGRGGA